MQLSRDFEQVRDRTFDIVVIGGGVTGVAIAREAAARGYLVCCVEKNDFGWATSAATSKLLHGGLRYLANYEFGIVRESLRERRVMGCAAPHLVRPLKFLMPIYQGEKPTRLEMKLALLLYDLLAFDRNRGVPEDKRLPPHRWLNRRRLLALEPHVPPHGAGGGELQGGFVYYDYQSLFPERLLLDWALTATGQGAILLNHCELTGVEYHAEPTKRVAAVVVRDLLTDTDHKISTGLLINASGPYMDLVPGLADVAGPHLTRAAGIHLITDPLFPSGQNHSIIVSARRNHSFLILPWQGRALIGPTDQPYEGHPDALVPRAAEVDLLVADLKEALPPGVFRRDMIRHVITGIRPLVSSGAPAAGGSTTRGLSRKSEIFDHAPAVRGLLSVGGGKWTTSRALGERVIKIARKQLKSPGRHAKVDTARDALAGAPGFAESAQEYAAFALREYATPGIPDPVHRHLITMYGTRHSLVLELARDTPALAARISERSHCLDILAQVDFAIQNESAANLDDIVRRRLSIGMFGEPAADELATIAERAADLLGWDAERRRLEIAAVHKIFRAAMAALQPG